jgi:hypothetical protein
LQSSLIVSHLSIILAPLFLSMCRQVAEVFTPSRSTNHAGIGPQT